MRIRSYTQHAVVLFRNAPKKTFYPGIVRVRHTQGRADNCPYNPLHRYLAFREYLYGVPGIFQLREIGLDHKDAVR